MTTMESLEIKATFGLLASLDFTMTQTRACEGGCLTVDRSRIIIR